MMSPMYAQHAKSIQNLEQARELLCNINYTVVILLIGSDVEVVDYDLSNRNYCDQEARPTPNFFPQFTK